MHMDAQLNYQEHSPLWSLVLMDGALAQSNPRTPRLGHVLNNSYGWIIPAESVGDDISRVGTFLERPAEVKSANQWHSDGLVTTFAVVGRVGDLLTLFDCAMPALADRATGQFVNATG